MGISPIEYRPWKGERTAQNLRAYVILRSVFKHSLKSNWVKMLLILAFILVYVFQIIMILIEPPAELDEKTMSNNFNAAGIGIFAMILAAIVTSDLISQDLSNNSFVLYFSRALKTSDYIIGKTGGALMVLGLLCALPPFILAVFSIGVQTGGDYFHSFVVLGKTIVAGVLVTVFFVPYGMMMSSLTKKKSYAAIGTFMSFFALSLIAGMFSGLSDNDSWNVISPVESMVYCVDLVYGQGLPSSVNSGALSLFVFCLVVVPAFILYFRIDRKAVGK